MNRTCKRCAGEFNLDEFRPNGAHRSQFSDYCRGCQDARTGEADQASVRELRSLFGMDEPERVVPQFSSLAAASQEHINQVRAVRGGQPSKRWNTI